MIKLAKNEIWKQSLKQFLSVKQFFVVHFFQRKGKEIRYKLLSQDLGFLLPVFQEATISTYPFQRNNFCSNYSFYEIWINFISLFSLTFLGLYIFFQPVYLFEKKYMNFFRREIANLNIYYNS